MEYRRSVGKTCRNELFLTTDQNVEGNRLCETTDFVATSLIVFEFTKYNFRTKREFPIMINDYVLIK